MAARKDEEEGLVTFERRHVPLSQLPEWETCEGAISAKLHLDATGNAVEDGHGMLQALYLIFCFTLCVADIWDR